MAEQEGVQGGGVSADRVVDQAFDLAGRRTDFTLPQRSSRHGDGAGCAPLPHGTRVIFLEQAVQQGHGSAQMEDGFLEMLKAFSARSTVQGLAKTWLFR